MSHGPTTRSSLLVRLRDARDEEAWSHFVCIYAPLVYRFARRRGLQDSDSGDITQEVLRAVLRQAGQLDLIHHRGSLRSWLFTVAHHKLCDAQKQGQRPGRGSGDSGADARLYEQPAREERDAWEREYRTQLFAWAAARVQEQCSTQAWQAFRLTAVEGQGAAAVARQLGMTVAAVYLAKSRVMARLKEQIRRWEEDEGPDGSARLPFGEVAHVQSRIVS
jgi:RNA polymerase sigma-70 factor (ECF subfamily)